MLTIRRAVRRDTDDDATGGKLPPYARERTRCGATYSVRVYARRYDASRLSPSHPNPSPVRPQLNGPQEEISSDDDGGRIVWCSMPPRFRPEDGWTQEGALT